MGGDRDRGDRQRRGGAVHRQDVVGVDVVHRHRLGDELGLEVPALREQRADRAVDHPRGQRRLLARAALAAEEGAGDLARGVHPLLDVDGQGQEVDVAQVAHRRGAEDHRVPGAHDDGSARLLGELAGLEGDLALADLHRDAAHVKHAHVVSLPPAARLAALWLQNSRSLSWAMLQWPAGPAARESAEPSVPPRNTAGVAGRPRPGSRTRSRAGPAPRPPPSAGRASKRSRSRPSRSARSQRCGSSTRPRSAKSESTISKNAPWRPPRPRRRRAARASAGACWRPGSGGRRAAAAARAIRSQAAAQCGQPRSR